MLGTCGEELFDQSARTRYYSPRRKENEPICDFLVRLNGYARTAKIQYEKGGADAGDHVEHFLLHCGDDDAVELIYPLQLEDIGKVEQNINCRIERTSRYCVVSSSVLSKLRCRM
ncbi:hypothetical protein PC120_g15254 [Phytophthora cactorum]|nr:hypothetical protein PC120_g15254 [Phytophthora cactorum]